MSQLTPEQRYRNWASTERDTRFLKAMRMLLDGNTVNEVANSLRMDRITAEVHRKALFGELCNEAVYGGKHMGYELLGIAPDREYDVIKLRKAGLLITEIVLTTGKTRKRVMWEINKYKREHPGYRFPIETRH